MSGIIRERKLRRWIEEKETKYLNCHIKLIGNVNIDNLS